MNEQGGRFGFVHLVPGVSTRNVWALLWGSFVAIGLLTFIKTIQPYLFTVNLNLPRDVQGTVAGQLEFMQEIVVLLSIGLFGALADRIGRRPVFALGFALLGTGYLLFPFAGSVPELLAYRLVFALGCAAVGGMLATVLSDYPQDRSREGMTAIVYFLNGLGVIVFAVALAKLPQWFHAAGATPTGAARDALFLVAGVAFVSALIMWALKPGVPTVRTQHLPLLALLREGISAARNPRILLAYGTAFASRADIAAVGTFTILWGVQAGIAEGLTEAQATARAGLLTAVIQGAALLWSPIYAWISSKLDRTTAVVIAMLLASIGYFAFGSVDDPLLKSSIPGGDPARRRADERHPGQPGSHRSGSTCGDARFGTGRLRFLRCPGHPHHLAGGRETVRCLDTRCAFPPDGRSQCGIVRLEPDGSPPQSAQPDSE